MFPPPEYHEFRLELRRINVPPKDSSKIDRLKDEPSGFGLSSKMNRSHSTPDLAQVLHLIAILL